MPLRARFTTRPDHSWPSPHFHQTRLLELAIFGYPVAAFREAEDEEMAQAGGMDYEEGNTMKWVKRALVATGAFFAWLFRAVFKLFMG